MGSEGDNSHEDELYRIIAAVYQIVEQVEKRFDDLRQADREATRNAFVEMQKRLEGFPELYASRTQLEQTQTSLSRLEAAALSRENFEQNFQQLRDLVLKLDHDKLTESVFDTFVDNYRLELEHAVNDRRNVVETLGSATNQVREQIAKERGDFVSQEMYDQRHQGLVNQVDAIERWQYKLVGGLVFATFVAPLLTAIIVYFLTHRTG